MPSKLGTLHAISLCTWPSALLGANLRTTQVSHSVCKIMRCNPRAFAIARRSTLSHRVHRRGLPAPWSRLFCSVVPSSGQSASNLDTWPHSNPQIQSLLDRYEEVCKDVPDVPPAGVRDAHAGNADNGRAASRAVFSNNLVDLSRIEVVGFDYDYTLATCEVTALFV